MFKKIEGTGWLEGGRESVKKEPSASWRLEATLLGEQMMHYAHQVQDPLAQWPFKSHFSGSPGCGSPGCGCLLKGSSLGICVEGLLSGTGLKRLSGLCGVQTLPSQGEGRGFESPLTLAHPRGMVYGDLVSRPGLSNPLCLRRWAQGSTVSPS